MRLAPDADPDEVLCVCRGITRGQIQAAIERQGLGKVQEITAALGAGGECGACAPALQELLGDGSAWTEVTAVNRVLSTDPEDPARIEQVDFLLPEHARYPASFAGQHVTVQGLIDGRWVSRTYTVIRPGPHAGVVSVAMRRVEGGQFTPWLLDPGASPKRLRIAAPMGADLWAEPASETVCLVGGIGVTLARSLLERMPAGATVHLDYSARSRGDLVFLDEFKALGERNPGFTLHCRTDDAVGYIRQRDVAEAVVRFPQARFVLCGPPAYVGTVQAWLLHAGIPASRIHIEKFYLPPPVKPVRRSWKDYGYRVGMLAALLPALWLLPGFEQMVPHHAHNVGHEDLECTDCHRGAPGTLRQQLQAKVDFWLGRREVDAPFMFKAVSNPVCLDCHKRSDDRHPSHRFLEPRFSELRDSLGPQQCISCHREHHEVRLTLSDTGFCSACHAELDLKKDPVTPTHAQLIQARRWETCLGCHDFHNNHGWKAPVQLADAIPPEKIRAYFAAGPSPYGEVREKAEKKLPAHAAQPPSP